MAGPAQRPPRIVIVGGGAGGLALATQLGRRLGRTGQAEVQLVDLQRTHVWKPLLHQLAAGSQGALADELEYLAQARWSGFRFQLGELTDLDRQDLRIALAPLNDAQGQEILPRREIGYDTLVLAVGSRTHDFATPGAGRHAIALDDADSARRFHERLIQAYLRAQSQPRGSPQSHLSVVIVGGGATGVELAAELHASARRLSHYGFDHVQPERDLQLVLIEAAPRLLSALPERMARAAQQELHRLGVKVHTGERVVEVLPHAVRTQSGQEIAATVVVWAAGVKAPDFLQRLAQANGLQTNELQQLVVTGCLQTTRDPAIYALGDCAACPQPGGRWVPPRAQAAAQQAHYLAWALPLLAQGQAVPPFVFRDRGSLVSLSERQSVGQLIGSLGRGSLFVEGRVAGLMYWALHKRHQLALGGWRRTLLMTLSELLDRAWRPRIKLH